MSRRSPSARQRRLLSLWGLLLPGPMVLCNLLRAEQIARRRLRRAGVPRRHLNAYLMLLTPFSMDFMVQTRMVYLAGATCHTFTSSNSHLYWVRCPTFSGFLTPSEVASFIGLPRYGAFTQLCAAFSSSSKICYCLAESIPTCMSVPLARFASAFLSFSSSAFSC